MQLQEKKNKAFTLIELLVVVAIVGILASIGIYGFDKFTVAGKISATKSQHHQIKKFIESSYGQCKLDKNKNLILKTCSNSNDWYCNFGGTIISTGQIKRTCSSGLASASNMAYAFVYHFNNEGFSNLYNTDGQVMAGIGGFNPKQCCLMQSWDPRPGSTHIWGDNNSNKINIKTNVGDNDGKDFFINDFVIWPGAGFYK